jgi:hypothetical protein
MAYQRVRALLEQLAEYCTQHGIAYRLQQLYDCLATYDRLLAATHSQQKSLAIVETLIDQAKTKGNTFAWLDTELRFETYAAAMGSRVQAAKTDLERQTNPDDAALDIYNERVNRFATG